MKLSAEGSRWVSLALSYALSFNADGEGASDDAGSVDASIGFRAMSFDPSSYAGGAI